VPIPLLILSDAPTCQSGLGRITRDLATRIHAQMSDVLRVATAGYAGSYSRLLGFPQYGIDMQDWVVLNLPDIWEDFAGQERGIVMTIWDPSRLAWFSHPQKYCPNKRLRTFLVNAQIRKWGYFPMDATGIHDRLTASLKEIISGYHRILAYSEWAAAILDRTFAVRGTEHLPHGIDTSIFAPKPRVQARHGFGQKLNIKWVKGPKQGTHFAIPDDAMMIGIVATNQVRKDWGLGLATVAELAKTRNISCWCHVDILEKHWSLPSLSNDYSLAEVCALSAEDYTDEQMCWAYSACDVTLGIGTGEGFGFPIFESLACGTPCIHGNDGGAPEHMPTWMLVEPVASRIEGPYNCIRNVYSPRDFANAALRCREEEWSFPSHLDWNNLWPRWEEWLRRGLK
jgi:glycosyltransferase involved in cell wall biosynthesis